MVIAAAALCPLSTTVSAQQTWDPLDSDSDGLSDAWETAYFSGLGKDGTDDSDADTVSALREFQLGLNPTLAKSDGVANDWEGFEGYLRCERWNGIAGNELGLLFAAPGFKETPVAGLLSEARAPGWGMDKIFTADPCTSLGAYIFYGRNPRTWKLKETVDVFSAKEIIYDSGNSGPGRVNVTADAEFSFSGDTPSTGNSSIFGWSFYAELTAGDNIFDFDPQKVGIRDNSGFAYKEAITRLAYYTGKYSGLGKNFNIVFDGSRTIIKSGSCCCKNTGNSMLSCSKIGNVIGE